MKALESDSLSAEVTVAALESIGKPLDAALSSGKREAIRDLLRYTLKRVAYRQKSGKGEARLELFSLPGIPNGSIADGSLWSPEW